VSAKLIFRNNDNPVGGPHEADVTTSVKLEILPPGTTIQFPKQRSGPSTLSDGACSWADARERWEHG